MQSEWKFCVSVVHGSFLEAACDLLWSLPSVKQIWTHVLSRNLHYPEVLAVNSKQSLLLIHHGYVARDIGVICYCSKSCPILTDTFTLQDCLEDE